MDSRYKTPAYTLERDKGGSLTIGSGSLTASPVLYLGIIEDVVGLSWTYVSFANDGPSQTFDDGQYIRKDQTIATGQVVTLGIAPVTVFRTLLAVSQK